MHGPADTRASSRPASAAEPSPIRFAAVPIEVLARQVNLLERELAQARHDLDQGRAELRRARAHAAGAMHQAERTKATISYRLGAALLRARTWPGLRALPGEIGALIADSRARRRSHRSSEGVQERRWRDLFAGAPDDVETAIAYVRGKGLPDDDTAQLLAALAKGRRAYDMGGAVELGRAASECDRRPERMAWLALLMFDSGMVAEPAALAAAALGSGAALDPTTKARLGVVLGQARISKGFAAPARSAAAYAAAARTLTYVAASSLPHHVSGYTTRTHNLCREIQGHGWDVQILTRMGYPWDRSDAKDVDPGRLVYPVGPLTYERIKGRRASDTPFDIYVEQAATAIAARVKATRSSLVHAASNYVNGLPALVAARRLGVPFVYTVRGLWEFTTAAKQPGWETSERFAIQRELETLVAREADVVLTLTEGLRSELIGRGIAAERIRLAPNSVDVEQFRPMPKDRARADALGLSGRFVVGFLGSVIDYEGLDDLLTATLEAVAAGVDMAVLVVGDGPALPILHEQVRHLGLTDRVVMTGRVPPTEVPSYYSLIDAAAFPRKPFHVCEIVSPLKPLEAMAMAKPVVASDVAALAEMVRHDETGLLFPKGVPSAMAEALVRLATTPELASRLGANARHWVESERTWAGCAADVIQVYEDLIRRSAGGAG